MEDVKKLKIVNSEQYNPWYNLALEEHFLSNIESGEVMLYLWQNDKTVVIGRNQNAWKECRVKKLEEKDGGFLARRLSGGGAVYHDLGNLNFTFIMDRDLYDLDKQLEVILKAVNKLGINAEFSGRNDLTVNGKKFSGNAFYFGSDNAYHHGTLMFETDFEKLVDYLQVSEEKIKSKGVESVRSRVANLKEINPEITLNSLKEALKESFKEVYEKEEINEENYYNPSELEEIVELYNKYSSWDWRYGKTPDFDISFEKRFNWGEIELAFNLKNAVIEKVDVYSDAMDVGLIESLKEELENTQFKKDEILKSIEKLKEVDSNFSYSKAVNYSQVAVVDDLKNWLADKDI
ncbi:MAG: lipoate--protein ligase [Bacillota bacterium]